MSDEPDINILPGNGFGVGLHVAEDGDISVIVTVIGYDGQGLAINFETDTVFRVALRLVDLAKEAMVMQGLEDMTPEELQEIVNEIHQRYQAPLN